VVFYWPTVEEPEDGMKKDLEERVEQVEEEGTNRKMEDEVGWLALSYVGVSVRRLIHWMTYPVPVLDLKVAQLSPSETYPQVQEHEPHQNPSPMEVCLVEAELRREFEAAAATVLHQTADKLWERRCSSSPSSSHEREVTLTSPRIRLVGPPTFLAQYLSAVRPSASEAVGTVSSPLGYRQIRSQLPQGQEILSDVWLTLPALLHFLCQHQLQ
jgi:hypothetical protein